MSNLIMIVQTFRYISDFSSVNTTIQLIFGTLFLCLHHTNKEKISAKIILSLLYKMRGFIGTILCLMMFNSIRQVLKDFLLIRIVLVFALMLKPITRKGISSNMNKKM